MNFYCHFCDKRCTKNYPYSNHWFCKDCRVFYKDDGTEIVFRLNSKTHLYWLYIKIDSNTTEVYSLRDPKSMTEEERMDLDPMTMPRVIISCKPAMQGVTPQNMHDKLKTLLIFS